MSEFHTLTDGEGVELQSNVPFRFACCDCGLVHDMVIVSQDGTPVGFAIKRMPEATEERRAALASAPVADESPMAKMADALREKARQERQAYQDRRNQATEWGPLPEGTEADHPISNAPVAHVAGNETSRYLEWAKDRSAWEMPVGTPVYYSAMASAPVAGEAEPVAYCQPDDPINSSAFSWPGLGRKKAHTVPLYAAPQASEASIPGMREAARLLRERASDLENCICADDSKADARALRTAAHHLRRVARHLQQTRYRLDTGPTEPDNGGD